MTLGRRYFYPPSRNGGGGSDLYWAQREVLLSMFRNGTLYDHINRNYEKQWTLMMNPIYDDSELSSTIMEDFDNNVDNGFFDDDSLSGKYATGSHFNIKTIFQVKRFPL